MMTDARGWFTEYEEPQEGSDGWYICWTFDGEDGLREDYAERFDTEAEAAKAIA